MVFLYVSVYQSLVLYVCICMFVRLMHVSVAYTSQFNVFMMALCMSSVCLCMHVCMYVCMCVYAFVCIVLVLCVLIVFVSLVM